MQNPFTTTFSKMPETTYISTDQVDEIIENFSYEKPSESVYKITGVRGSGKTVILARIENEFKNNLWNKDWLVYDLNPSRDILKQLGANLLNDGYGKANTITSLSASVSVLGSGGSFGYQTSDKNSFFDIGVQIENLLKDVQKNHKKILIGIDEVSKNKEMIEFVLEFGKWLRAQYPVYLICTGLYENVLELSNVKNLTFFQRATTIKTEPLNQIKMMNMYVQKLNIDLQTAKLLAKTTKGYAYAFQQLGVLFFKNQDCINFNDIILDLQNELFSYSYEKIWNKLTDNDRILLKIMTEDREYKREEIIKSLNDKANIYSVYRDCLLKRGLLNSRQAFISLSLPFFEIFIKEYC